MDITDTQMVTQIRERIQSLGYHGFNPYTVQEVITARHGRLPLLQLNDRQFEEACQRSTTWND